MNTAEDPLGVKKPETTVYLFNMSEDVWPFIMAMSDPAAQKAEIEENADLGDRDLFSLALEDSVLFIAPRGLSPEFLSYYADVVGNKNVQVVSPAKHSGELCEDVMADPTVMGKIMEAANSSRKVTMSSYSTTAEFLHLVKSLRAKGLTIFTPEAPEEDDAWTVNFYGSKSGIRQLAQQSKAAEPDFVMPEGLICMGIEDAAKIAAKMYIKENGVVLKTNKGHSGAGLLIFRPSDLPTEYSACEKEILSHLSKDPYWAKFPIVIEEFITSAPTIGGGYPNVEYKIMKNGRIEFLYYCAMRVTKQGVFRGVEINNEVVADRTSAQMVDTGFYIAERYAAAGYRGYFDVDFVASKSGVLYVTETNVRRTGGTHVYNTAVRLFGKDFMYETFILSDNSYNLPGNKKMTFVEMRDRVSPILFDKKTKEGLVIVSENVLTRWGKLAYIIFGKTKKHALDIEAKMEELVK
jgi:hypothetical protein